MSVSTVLLIVLFNTVACLVLPRLLTLNWVELTTRLFERDATETAAQSKPLSLGENPSQL